MDSTAISYLDGLNYVQHGNDMFDNQYIIMPGRVLGKGQSSVVHACMSLESGKQFACKVIPKIYPADIDDEMRSCRRNEVIALHHLSGEPNIVSLETVFEDKESIRLVTGLCDGGDLFAHIPPTGHYTEPAAALLLQQLMQCIAVCHRNGLIHRDVKPENFLFVGTGRGENSKPVLKMIDFGLAVFHTPGELQSQIVGSPSYAAPEILQARYGPEVDVWAAGVILHYMLCGSLPFTPDDFWDSNHQLFLQSGSYWPRVSDDAKLLVKAMLQPDPRLRPRPEEVLEHPWVRKNGSCVPRNKLSTWLSCTKELIQGFCGNSRASSSTAL